jgi:thiosulfate/3-mercaptopyruvate sulfurtransferase
MTDVTTAELASRLWEEGLLLLDVRAEVEYTGEAGAPCDPRQGRIPGARHVDLAQLLVRDREELRALVEGEEGSEVIAYCHSGNRSAYAVEILAAAGYRARNYRGSWHEWSRDPSLPIETGLGGAGYHASG